MTSKSNVEFTLRQAPETYTFPITGQDVRVVTIDGEPWFVGRDVAAALGYANPRKAVRDHVPADGPG